MAKKKSGNRKKKSSAARRNNNKSPVVDPSTTVCKFYAEGRCKNGDECKFLHTTDAKGAATAPAATTTVPEVAALPAGLASSMSLFTPAQQQLATKLCTLPGTTNQRHLFETWSSSSDSKNDDKKKALMSKLELVDQSYPDGGLLGYLSNAVTLLEKSRRGENPLEGWIPSVPKGEAFEVGTDAFLKSEELGLKEVGKCGFILVAGGLGERLGYGDIKVSSCWSDCTLLQLSCVGMLQKNVRDTIYSNSSYYYSVFQFRSVCQPSLPQAQRTFNFTLRPSSPFNLDTLNLEKSFLSAL